MGITEKQVQALIVRALKTFLQAFLAVLLAGLVNVTDMSAAKALAVSALAAGISAIMNVVVRPEEAK